MSLDGGTIRLKPPTPRRAAIEEEEQERELEREREREQPGGGWQQEGGDVMGAEGGCAEDKDEEQVVEEEEDVVDVEEEEEEPPRSPLIVAVGLWVKVFDYGQWYSAKVLEEDEDGDALVHFHMWNSKWDQWIDLAGDRIRLPSPHPQRSAAAALQGVGGVQGVGGGGGQVGAVRVHVRGEMALCNCSRRGRPLTQLTKLDSPP